MWEMAVVSCDFILSLTYCNAYMYTCCRFCKEVYTQVVCVKYVAVNLNETENEIYVCICV